MATIYKRTRDKGKRRVSYWIQYRDHKGCRRTTKGYTDKALTEQLAAKLEHEAHLRRQGLIDPEQERLAAEISIPLVEQIDAYERSLRRKGNSEKHTKLVIHRIKRVMSGSGFETFADVNCEAVEEFLSEYRAEKGFGFRTHNHYAQAVDAFCRWMVSQQKVASNPLRGLPRLNAESDVRHQRRALSAEEVAKLIDSARKSGKLIQCYDGETRAMIYLMGYLTGLRRKELASLTPQSFDFESTPPTLTVEAACSKHRKRDTLPLHPELIAVLPAWLAGKSTKEPLFQRLAKRRTWFMVKSDLERVGIPYRTEAGIADFHAAGRHSYVTGLLQSGVSLVETRELARHGDVRMTMRYTHIGLESQARAIQSLSSPSLGKKISEKDLSNDCSHTGDPTQQSPENDEWLHIGCNSRVFEGHTESLGGNTPTREDVGNNDANPMLVGACVNCCPSESPSGEGDESGGGGNRTRVLIATSRCCKRS